MTVVIRMKRTGRRNRPCYRIAVADSRSPRDGRIIESLGLYDPIAPKQEEQIQFDVERARYWIEQGAQPSETVRSILKRHGVEQAPQKKRDRSNRKTVTKTGERKAADKKARAERKASRASERKAQRSAAKKAAAAAGEGSE